MQFQKKIVTDFSVSNITLYMAQQVILAETIDKKSCSVNEITVKQMNIHAVLK